MVINDDDGGGSGSGSGGGGVNIMHHLGQRCMLTIVSALQIQNLSRLGLNS